jgi:uncharacterized protein
LVRRADFGDNTPMDSIDLQGLLGSLRLGTGLTRKKAIGGWARPFAARARMRPDVYGPGDDAGAVRLEGGYVLLSGEGMLPEIVEGDPEFAGFCAVTVNVNDIFAMGGTPLGLLTVAFEGDMAPGDRDALVRGLEQGLDHYGVPMLGGHTSPGEGPARVAVCIAGWADRLLRGDGAGPGHALIAAVDIEGERHPRFAAWDSVRKAAPQSTMAKLASIATLGERGLAAACRDISNPGLLGTLAMMVEESRAGATVDLGAVPRPDGVELGWWLEAYPSLGFLLAVPEEHLAEATDLIGAAGLACARIGDVTEGSSVDVSLGSQSGLFVDWAKDPVTGIF